MPLDLVHYERKVHQAIQSFWGAREAARQRQIEAGSVDQGERSGVTAGKNMDGFVQLIAEVIRANGLSSADIHVKKAVLTLPGFYRPTKIWDLLAIYKDELVAAVELKSQVGPSFGNNFNNRAEEAIGTAHDLWTAYREGAFGEQPRPFVGWLILVEDAPGSRSPVKDRSPHFPVFEEFAGASYLERYDLLCRKLSREQLYTAAAVIAASRQGARGGRYASLSDLSDIGVFIASLAGHTAATAARLRNV